MWVAFNIHNKRVNCCSMTAPRKSCFLNAETFLGKTLLLLTCLYTGFVGTWPGSRPCGVLCLRAFYKRIKIPSIQNLSWCFLTEVGGKKGHAPRKNYVLQWWGEDGDLKCREYQWERYRDVWGTEEEEDGCVLSARSKDIWWNTLPCVWYITKTFSPNIMVVRPVTRLRFVDEQIVQPLHNRCWTLCHAIFNDQTGYSTRWKKKNALYRKSKQALLFSIRCCNIFQKLKSSIHRTHKI